MIDHFNDKSKYRLLTYDPTEKIQTKNNEITRKLLERKYINKHTKKKLLNNSAQAPQPRATPKIHKPGALRHRCSLDNPPTVLRLHAETSP